MHVLGPSAGPWGKLWPVAYFSGELDPVEAGLPRCWCAIVAIEEAVLASRDIVGHSDLTLLVPQAVSLILLEQKTSFHSTLASAQHHPFGHAEH